MTSKYAQVNLRLPTEVVDALKQCAKANRRSLPAEVTARLTAYLREGVQEAKDAPSTFQFESTWTNPDVEADNYWRNHFAGIAMDCVYSHGQSPKAIAERAFDLADAMVERSKK